MNENIHFNISITIEKLTIVYNGIECEKYKNFILGGLKMSKEEMIEEIKKMTVVELSELVKAIEEEFGVSAVAAAAPVAGGAAGEAAEEKSSFNVVLKEAGDQKIKVIKVVRDATGLGLKEAKDLVDGAPKTVKENVSKEEAEDLKAKFTEVRAVIELQ